MPCEIDGSTTCMRAKRDKTVCGPATGRARLPFAPSASPSFFATALSPRSAPYIAAPAPPGECRSGSNPHDGVRTILGDGLNH
eukprot:5157734-Prymnesium_polylepis.1